MELAILACCKCKRSDGETAYRSEHSITGLLSPESGAKLMSARRELGGLRGLPQGPDLGANEGQDIRFLPAYLRYQGNAYQAARLTERDISEPLGIELVIVSALYGLVSGRESIRDYNLTMTDKLPSGKRVITWWKSKGLGHLLSEVLIRSGARHVYDLVSEKYLSALSGWPPASYPGYERPSYTQMRTGAEHHRGAHLRRALDAKHQGVAGA